MQNEVRHSQTWLPSQQGKQASALEAVLSEKKKHLSLPMPGAEHIDWHLARAQQLQVSVGQGCLRSA